MQDNKETFMLSCMRAGTLDKEGMHKRLASHGQFPASPHMQALTDFIVRSYQVLLDI